MSCQPLFKMDFMYNAFTTHCKIIMLTTSQQIHNIAAQNFDMQDLRSSQW